MATTILRERNPTMLRLNIRALEQAMVRQRYNSNTLAIATGLHRNTVYNLLKGESQPSLETTSKLANALETNPFSLLEDVETDEERASREKRTERERRSAGTRFSIRRPQR